MRTHLMRQWGALLSMIRFGNALLAAAGITLGYALTHPLWDFATLILLVMAGVTALGFGNVINDSYDVDTDCISHPQRPLARGAVTLTQARGFALLLALVALLCGCILSVAQGVLVLAPLILLWGYARFGKGTPFLGNLLVSLLVAYTLIFGAWGAPLAPLVTPALLAMLLNFLREVVKDNADLTGDLAVGIETTAVVDRRVQSWILMITLGATTLLTPLPYVRGDFGLSYLSIALTATVVGHGVWWQHWQKKEYAKAAKTLKWMMVGGLVALWYDRFF